MTGDTLAEITDKISADVSAESEMPEQSSFFSKYYGLDGNNTPPVLSMPVAANSLLEGHKLSSVARTDIVVAPEMEEFEASSKSMLEVSSWLDGR